jgi:hypothetical protein
VIGNLEPEENVLQWFEQTSDEPYTRHDYKIVYTNKKPVVFDNYEDFRKSWWETPNQFLSHSEVLDHKEKKNKSGGFK